MKKTLILFALLLFSVISIFAQRQFDNSVKLHADGFYVPEYGTHFNLCRQIGVSYERRILGDLFISAGFAKWVVWEKDRVFKNIGYGVSEPVDNNFSKVLSNWGPSNLYYNKAMTGAKMVDIEMLYKFQLSKRQILSGGIGASYFWGDRIYSYEYMVIGGDTGYGEMVAEKINTLGVVPQISYDCFLLNSLSIGADIRARYYTQRVGGQYDYGLHVGVNF